MIFCSFGLLDLGGKKKALLGCGSWEEEIGTGEKTPRGKKSESFIAHSAWK